MFSAGGNATMVALGGSRAGSPSEAWRGARGQARSQIVIRPDTVRAYAAEAGFSQVEVLPIEIDFWRFYRVAP